MAKATGGPRDALQPPPAAGTASGPSSIGAGPLEPGEGPPAALPGSAANYRQTWRASVSLVNRQCSASDERQTTDGRRHLNHHRPATRLRACTPPMPAPHMRCPARSKLAEVGHRRVRSGRRPLGTLTLGMSTWDSLDPSRRGRGFPGCCCVANRLPGHGIGSQRCRDAGRPLWPHFDLSKRAMMVSCRCAEV